MELLLESNDIQDYLQSTEIINFEQNSNIRDLADRLNSNSSSKLELIKNTYEYVRENISHSADFDGKIVTCKASEVLKAGEGICYAKSHLLAALLRYLKIPTGFCYQKLILDYETKPYLILHGLNAIYIEELERWIRVDARGNKKGVNAEFSVDYEQLAFPVRKEFGESDEPTIFVSPNLNVIKSLETAKTVKELFDNLPKTL
jgi:transglutaminase-like putative cysteine protease